ncbi:SDR family NAD(P)-dependent oxidoreductase [Candidatus Hydrogenedentota bacterium]
MTLKDRTALITGSCGEGMGRSAALRLAREGVNIVLNYGTQRRGAEMSDSAEKIATALEKLGGQVITCEADTRSEEEVARMIEIARKKFGHVDILINNAGGAWQIRDYTEIDLAHWKEVLSAEIDGAFLTMKHIVPGMRERGWGRVIHLGLSGALGIEGVHGAPDYCLGKAARSWMTTAFGMPELKKGITVNCIEPGLTPRMSLEDAVKTAEGGHLDAEVSAFEPGSEKAKWRGQWSERPGPLCHDVAEIIAFLCSDAGKFVTGNLIRLPHFG